MIFILFLFASWLAGSMMNFQFEAGEGGSWDISFIGPFITIILFAIPVAIFWRARTRIFFILFSAGLFFIITPVFFQALTVLLIGFTLAGVILIFVVLKKGYISKKNAFGLIGIILVLGGGIFYWFMTIEDDAEEGVLSDILGETGSFLGEFEGAGFFVLILISVFGLGFFLYQRYELHDLFDFTEDKRDEKEIESDVSSAVDKAIRDILEGKDIKATILECYNQMSLILEDKGIRDEKHMTPREFENAANESLDVTTSKISRIREIFELAKYSSHRLEEEDKEKVIEDLEALRDELG